MPSKIRILSAAAGLALALVASGCAYTVTSPVGISVRGPALAVSVGSPCATASQDVAPIAQVTSRARFAVGNLIRAMQAKAFARETGPGIVSSAPLVLASCQY